MNWLPTWLTPPPLPPLPSWNAAHPLIVHLPIGVLAVVPVLLLFTMFARRMRQPFAFMTLLVLAIGAAGTFAAVLSGEEAMQGTFIAGGAPGTLADEHEELGEWTRNVFCALAAIYAVIFLAAVGRGEKFGYKMWFFVHVLFLCAFAYGFIQLANTGHMGARLVHEHGVRAPLVVAPGGPADGATDQPMPDDGEDDK